MRRIIGMLALIAASLTHAQPQVYQGHVGNARVVMEFEFEQDGQLHGRYFYRKYHTDIALGGKQAEDGELELVEKPPCDKDCTTIVLHPLANGWMGKWSSPTAKAVLSVKLTPLSRSAVTPLDRTLNPAVAQTITDSLYDYARLAGLALKQGKTQNFNGYTLQWMREPVSKMVLFRVQDGLSSEVLTRVNRILTQRHWQEVSAYFDCMRSTPYSFGSDYDQIVTPRLLNTRFLSASVFTSYYCGGAHPDFYDSPINLNLQTGKELRLEDLLWLGKGKAQLARTPQGSRLDYQYEQEVLTPWLLDAMKQHHPKQMDSDPASCNYNDAAVWQSVRWYLTPQGLHFNPSFARIERACEYPEWSVLPWKVVNQHPGSLGAGLP